LKFANIYCAVTVGAHCEHVVTSAQFAQFIVTYLMAGGIVYPALGKDISFVADRLASGDIRADMI
jgi:hypothetical protein